MIPFLGMAGGLMSIFGGLAQADQIRRATEERLRLMRLEAGKEIGNYKALAMGGTGVEGTSSTIQNQLARMRIEYDRAMAYVAETGSDLEGNSLMAGFAQGFGSFGSNLYQASKVTQALGEPQIQRKNPWGVMNDASLNWFKGGE